MTSRSRAAALALLLALSGATCAAAQGVMYIPNGIELDDSAGSVDQLFTQNLARLGDDRDRALAGQIDTIGYLRTNLDGQPVQVLEGLRPIGAEIVLAGMDPKRADSWLREVRFSDKALAQVPGNRFQPRDHLEFVVSVDKSSRMTLVRANFANGVYVSPEAAAKAAEEKKAEEATAAEAAKAEGDAAKP